MKNRKDNMKNKKRKTQSPWNKAIDEIAAEPRFQDINDETKETHVYMFHNVKHNINLFVDAENGDHACELFDKCDFPNRREWKIFLELGSQPA